MAELSSRALVTEADANLYLQIEDNSDESSETVVLVINLVSGAIEKATRKFYRSREYTEIIDGRGGLSIWTHKAPIIGTPVVSFWNDSKDAWEDVTGAPYTRTLVVNTETGELSFQDRSDLFAKGAKMIKIVYTAGVATVAEVPTNIQLAALELIGFYYKKSGDNLFGMSSKAIEGQVESYSLNKWPDNVIKLLAGEKKICL